MNMKIGDYVTVQDIANQSLDRWVVLVDLLFTDDGNIDGGTIKYIGKTKAEAGSMTAKLNLKGIPALLVCGDIEPLSVGGIFVK
jgi:hypothetical protein